MPLSNPETFRPQQETQERPPEARKIEGVRIVRVDEVAEQFAVRQRAEARQFQMQEQVAADDIQAIAERRQRLGGNAVLAAEFGKLIDGKNGERMKAAAGREGAELKAAEGRTVAELVKLEKDPVALEQWERGLEKEAAQLSAELKQSPDNAQVKARLAEVKVKLDTAMDLPAAKQRLLDWNRAQQPRVEALRMAA